MKRVLTLLLVLVLALAMLVACNDDNDGDNSGTTPPPAGDGTTDGGDGTTDGGDQQPTPDEDLQAAYDYIKLTYKTLSETATSFEVMKNAPIGDKIFAITWSTDNTAVTITESEDGNFYVVNIPELGDAAIPYALKFSIENDKGEKKEGSFSLTVPAFSVNTFDEYVAAEDGTLLTVEGIITGVIQKDVNSTKENSLFLQDLNGNGGYYIYNLDADTMSNYKVGMTVRVVGEKKNYNGTFELVKPVATVIDSTIKTVTPVDFTEVLASAESLDAVALTGKNGMLVKINGVTLLEYKESNGYHYFMLGNHKTYLRVSSSSNCITQDEGKALTKTFQDNFYNAADVVGIVAVYNGDFYLMPASAEPFTNFVEQEKPADVKVDIALENTTLPGLIQLVGETELPTSFSGFSDVTIAWTLTEGAGVAELTDGKLVISSIPTEAKNVTLKATATCGTVTAEKTYTIVVKPISTISIQEALNIGMNMAHNTYTEEKYYIVGTIDNVVSGNGEIYGNMFMENETGDYTIYIYGLYDSTGKVRYDAMNPKPLAKDTIKVLSSVGKYQNDVQLKSAWLIEHTVHEDNKVEPEPPVEFKPVNALVGTKYYFGMNQKNAFHFVTGVMATGNSKYYMATTAKLADAAVITVIAGPTADTYYITLTVDGATKYMDLVVSGTHKNAVYTDTAPEVGFSFNTELKVFYKELDGDNYTFGTDIARGFTTVGGVKVDAETNTMLQLGFAEEHTCTFTDEVTPPTCEEDGYTTHTCACGNVVVDTTVPALEHNYDENGECDREGCDATNHEHTYEDVVTPPTCTEAGYTTHTCTVPGCNKSYEDTPVEALGHSYTDGVCANGCGIDDPDYYYPISIEAALSAPVGKKVILTGTISEIKSPWNSDYNNMEAWLSDGAGNKILLYRIKTLVGVGDKVTVQGAIGVYKGVNQIAQDTSTVTVDEKHTCSEYTEATCQKLAECKVCGATTGDFADHTYAAAGVCSVCGHEEGAAEVVTATATMKYTGSTTTNMTGNNDAATVGLDATIFSVIGNKGSTNNNCGLNKAGQIRLYGNSSGGNGSYFTVSVAEGYTIESIKITFSNTTNNKNCQLTVNDDSTVFDGSTNTWQVDDINANSFKLQNVVTGSTQQIYIASIEITYVVPAAQ